MNTRHLLREIPACTNEISGILLINDSLCGQKFRILTADCLQQFFDFLSVREPLIDIFM
jgi:hypothetical protein